MTITRDQFIRGFSAIEEHYRGRKAIEDAMLDAGWDQSAIGYDPVVTELRIQLEERCGDTFDDPQTGTMISFALNEKGECGWRDILMTVDGAEALWTWWERTETGPFRPRGSLRQPGSFTHPSRDWSVEILTLAADLVDEHGTVTFKTDEARAIRDVLGRLNIGAV